jgi:hypothetical protein
VGLEVPLVRKSEPLVYGSVARRPEEERLHPFDFDGTTVSFGTGSFGAGFSPVQLNTVTIEVPGSATSTSGSPKNGGASSGPTFVTNEVPVSTGPTGGFGAGSGALNITSTTTGTIGSQLIAYNNIGYGSSVGEATSHVHPCPQQETEATVHY